MMKLRICNWPAAAIVLLFFACKFAVADSTFVAAGNVSGIWDAAGSPYVVQGNLIVQALDSLEIGNGVTVHFEGPYELRVLGYVAIQGLAGDSVRFTTDTLTNPAKWRGLSFINANDSSYIEYAIFENALANGATASDSLGGAIFAGSGSMVRIENSTFRFNRSSGEGGAVYFANSTLLMDSCFFQNNLSDRDGGALFIRSSAASIVTQTVFQRNRAARSGGGLFVRGGTPQFTSCVFDSNLTGVNGTVQLQLSEARFDSCLLTNNIANLHGGGFSCEQSSPRIYDCVIQNNSTNSFDGGGVYLWESSPHMLRCQVLGNSSADDGGGIHSYREQSNGLFEQCEIRGNSAAGEGAGVWVTLDGAPSFVDCIISQNTAGTHGGGVFLRNNARPSFVNCNIDSNLAHGDGGGISIRQSLPVLVECSFRQNTAYESGGGVQLWEAADAVLDGCVISNNSASLPGGGIAANQSKLTATNCIVVRNNAASGAGGVAVQVAANVNIAHATIAANSGRGVSVESGLANIENSIIAHSGAEAVYFSAAANSRITYSTISGMIEFASGNSDQGPAWIGVPVAVNGNGDSCDTYFNVFSDPMFTDTTGGDWSLSTGSAAVGSGNWLSVTTDQIGNDRPFPAGTLPDMGALESELGQAPTGLFGTLSGMIGPGEVKVVADVLVDYLDTLRIAAGTNITFCGPSGLLVLGELHARGSLTDSIRFTTDTLTNPGRWQGIRFEGNSSASVLEYTEVSDASAIVLGRRQEGGGLRIAGVSPTVSRSLFARLSALRGGGVYCTGTSTPSFTACNFVSCKADSGGVFYVKSGAAPVLDRCNLSGGYARAGGGYLGEGSSGSIRNSRIEGNAAITAGAGIFLTTSSTILENNLLLSNSSAGDGGAIWLSGSSAQVKFCSIAGNSATNGAGVYIRFGTPQINNSIIADNIGGGIYFYVASLSSVRYNCVASNSGGNFVLFANSPTQGPAGIGILDSVNANGDPCDRHYNHIQNPEWVAGTGHNYYLSQIAAGDLVNSPCVNAGDPAVFPPAGTTRTDYLSDINAPDQGYHGPQLLGFAPAINNLAIQCVGDSIHLYWSYENSGIFYIKTDSSSSGAFLTTIAVTADTTVTLPYAAPIHPTRAFFRIVAESAE
ncbi:right-handed parallel beta-helix repeat-containing protein [bacterium]|nr:right-handed parallel beta-helix repeat-containing protein [bacterium]